MNRRKASKKEYSKPVTKFESIDLSTANHVPIGMTRAYRNTRFTVMVYDNSKTTKGLVTQVLIQAHDALPIKRHWSKIQKIKNEIFGKEAIAIEFYPSESELIDDRNIYWIWVFDDSNKDLLPIPVFN